MSIKKIIFPGLLSLLFSFGFNLFQAAAQTTPDPGLMGSFAVSAAYYDLGDLAFTSPSFPDAMEVRGSVHYPTTLTAGPFPVLVFLHGRHETCYQTSDPSNTNGNWPCGAGYQSITSFEGYDYLANQMASHGYIVISISCNAINADDNSLADYGMQARAELMQHHLDLWNTYNTVGGAPFGTQFVGTLDMTNIGTMGHSRGGEGVVFNALYNKSLGSPYGIKAVLTLAPVDFERHVLNDIPFMNVAPYCDGDVSNIQGVHFYDDARYSVPTDDAPKHSVLMMGANHNFFNTVWTPGLYPAGGSDDWDDNYSSTDSHCGTSGTGNDRFNPAKQQAAFNAYASAFFRLYIGHETSFAPILEVDDIIPPASSTLDSSEVFVSYHAPYSKRLDINTTQTTADASTNDLSGNVIETGLVSFGICGGGLSETACGVSSHSSQEPHKGSSSTQGLSQMDLRWDSPTDAYENDIPPAYQNLTSFLDLQFRTAVNFHESTSGVDLNFSIQLTDAGGNVSTQPVGNYTHVLFHQPGTEFAELPKVLFNTIKIPLTAFTGVDMTQIQKIKFVFDQSTTGSILIADLALTGHPAVTTSVTNHFGTGNILVYPNPAASSVSIDLGDASKTQTKLSLYDIQGKLVYEQENVKEELIKIDLSDLTKGIYILNITNNTVSKNYKIIKQ